MSEIYQIIKSPIMTEKVSSLMPLRKYSFSVARDANKIEIKKAIEKIYHVKVTAISTMTVKGKTKRLRFNQPGKTKTWKKAIVTLKKGQEIKIT